MRQFQTVSTHFFALSSLIKSHSKSKLFESKQTAQKQIAVEDNTLNLQNKNENHRIILKNMTRIVSK